MRSTGHLATLVRVHREQGEGGWFYATSPDLRGLLVTHPTLDGLEAAVPQAITDLFAAAGTEVVVARVDEQDTAARSWVAIPQSLLAANAASRNLA